jgi:hypothetical protein
MTIWGETSQILPKLHHFLSKNILILYKKDLVCKKIVCAMQIRQTVTLKEYPEIALR